MNIIKQSPWSDPSPTDHKIHTMDVGLDCESCHYEMFEMLGGMAEDEDDFTMAAMKDGKHCGICHYEDGFAFSTETRCTSCHIGVRGVNRIADAADEKMSSNTGFCTFMSEIGKPYSGNNESWNTLI